MNSQTTVNQGGRFTNVTPLPWSRGIVTIWSDCNGAGSPLEEVASFIKEPDGRFIVEAVNSYHAHLERIRVLEGALRLVVNSGPLNNGMRDDNTMAEARAALKGD